MISLHNCPVLEIVSFLFLELYRLLQYSYDCPSVMSIHPDGGGSARDTRVSLTGVDMVSRLAKSCWMSTIPTVCRGSRQVVTALSEPFRNPPRLVWGVGGTKSHLGVRAPPVASIAISLLCSLISNELTNEKV